MNVNIRNALDPLSLQDYVALRKVMIKLEYQRMLLLLREEEQLHLEALEREAKEICEALKESVFRMSQYRESLKEMYGELMGCASNWTRSRSRAWKMCWKLILAGCWTS